MLAGIAWPHAVTGCVLSQEIVVLPPAAEDDVPDTGTAPDADIERAAAHPQRREARLVAGVLRDGTQRRSAAAAPGSTATQRRAAATPTASC